MKKSRVSTVKQPTIDQLENCYKIIAMHSISAKGLSCNMEVVENEALRIERCVEHYYIKEDHDMSFGEFACNFMMFNNRAIIDGTNFTGTYL